MAPAAAPSLARRGAASGLGRGAAGPCGVNAGGGAGVNVRRRGRETASAQRDVRGAEHGKRQPFSPGGARERRQNLARRLTVGSFVRDLGYEGPPERLVLTAHLKEDRMRLVKIWALPAALALPLAFAAGSAEAASRQACGNIELLAVGECHFEFEGGCKAKCEPLNLVAACDGKCNLDISVECKSDCSGSCQTECQVDPGKFDCKASCRTDCNAQVAARCNSGDNECISYCEADCESNCSAQCDVVAPKADCETKCNGCCSGSCETDANFDCSLKCSVDLQGGCEVACEKPEGALFCDGQYIAVNDLSECIQYIQESFNYKVEVKAEASASVSCAASNGASSAGGLALLGLAAGVAAARRRRRDPK